jgi:putative flippase GtrA
MISLLLLVGKAFEIYDNLDKRLKETLNYLIVGFLTTVVSIVSYYLLRLVIDSITICTVLSWILAVCFAYITNRVFVFQSKNTNYIKEIIDFVGSRIFSLLVELAVMLLLTKIFKIDDKIAKIIVQFIVVVLNYVTMKLFVFKKKEK